MSLKIKGNTKGLSPSAIKSISKLERRRLGRDELISIDLGRELCALAEEIGRQVGVLISREGHVEEIVVGTKNRTYLPDLGRYRLGRGRLRRLRFIYPDLSDRDVPVLPSDVYADLEKLRLDMVVAVARRANRVAATYAHIMPERGDDLPSGSTVPHTRTETVRDIGFLELDFGEFMSDLEAQLEISVAHAHNTGKTSAVLVGVYDREAESAKSSMAELEELARTAGVQVIDKIVQRKSPDPRTVLGSGKLEEVVLHCLRLGAELLIFDCELKPGQWRAITNSTELKILDRSMLILDIFAQRATSADGRLQVELAQLKYNLPRLVEMDTGLSRLTGGIGGRGPGETKLEIGRRRIRDRISDLEARISKLSTQRGLRRQRRSESGLAVVVLVGYTNVGKSSLFNALSASQVLVENKLFATLDPAHRRLRFPYVDRSHLERNAEVVLTDTVGFIRELPDELVNAFRATLEVLEEASVIVHVLDASDPEVLEKKAAVEKILSEMQYNAPRVVALNKCDLVGEQRVRELVADTDGGVPISALQKRGFGDLLAKIGDFLGEQVALNSKAPDALLTSDSLIPDTGG